MLGQRSYDLTEATESNQTIAAIAMSPQCQASEVQKGK